MPNLDRVGEKAIFIEHAVLLEDLDSKCKEATKVLVNSTDENFVATAEKFAETSKNTALYLNGNTLKGEYIGPTGRTVEAVYAVLKTGWVLAQEKTPDDGSIDIDEYIKFD